jgi:hypothetical protein
MDHDLSDYDLPPDPPEESAGRSARAWRRRLADQARENAELRRALRAYEEAAQRPPETPGPADDQPPDAAVLAASLDAERRALAEAEDQHALLARQPIGVSPADQQAAARIQAATDGAAPSGPDSGLEGLMTRLRDRGIPYPQLLQEMRSFGFRDNPPADD